MQLPPLYAPPAEARRPDAASNTPTETEFAATARRFEAAFLAPLVTEMLRSAGPASLGAGQAEEVWRSFQGAAIADEIAEGGGIGIAQSVARQLKAYGG